MRPLGWVIAAAGFIWMAIAFNMDVSVSSSSIYGPDEVVNLELLANRQNHLMISGLVTLIGALMAIFGRPGKLSDEPKSKESGGNGPDLAPSKRDLQLDQYRLWLASKHGISRNDLFEKYVLNEQLYDTLEDALAAAHAVEMDGEKTASLREETGRALQYESQNKDSDKVVITLALAVVGIAILLVADSSIKDGVKPVFQSSANAALKEPLGFQPPSSLSFIKRTPVKSSDSLAGMCGGSAGELFEFETDEMPQSINTSLDKTLGKGKTLAADDATRSLVYSLTKGRSLHVWASTSGKVYFCSTSSS